MQSVHVQTDIAGQMRPFEKPAHVAACLVAVRHLPKGNTDPAAQ
jgi:hypothetical protein